MPAAGHAKADHRGDDTSMFMRGLVAVKIAEASRLDAARCGSASAEAVSLRSSSKVCWLIFKPPPFHPCGIT